MILLQGQQLARTFADEVLFKHINLTIQDTSKIALVGRNGAGKSTLLKILAGIETSSEGHLAKQKDLKMAYLAQDTGIDSDLSVYETVLNIFAEVTALEAELATLEAAMSQTQELDELMKRYDQVSETFKQQGGFTYRKDIESLLHAFKFDNLLWSQPVSSLSGGQKTRLALAIKLLSKPDLLILDEPTNHLDIETLSWLETYLKSYKGALLIVSHDRYFLDQVVTEVLELSRGQMTRFAGNYSAYLDQKATLLASQQKQYDKQQKTLASLEDFVNRNIARASTTKRAQSRRKQLAKIERLEAPTAQEASGHFSFDMAHLSGNEVLGIHGLDIGYEGNKLSGPIDFDLRKTEALAVVGDNGVGKSTLIKTIMGQIPLLAGELKLGAHVSIGYYDQSQANLDPKLTVLETLWQAHSRRPELEIRNRLAAFLFTGEAVDKTVGMLSGGEKARLLLAKLSLDGHNLLVLDEPTNHLDIDSRQVLENALIDYEGTLLFVSHDRYFINRIASQVLELKPNGSTHYLGDYDYYLEKKASEQANLQIDQVQSSASEATEYQQQKDQQKLIRKHEREVARQEAIIQELETQSSQLETKMAQTSDVDSLIDLQAQLDEVISQQSQALEDWEKATLALEALSE